MIIASCIVCETEFQYQKEGSGRLLRFCSEDCKKIRGQRALRVLNCLACGAEFSPRYQSKGEIEERGAQRFCSIRCHRASTRLYEGRDEKERAKGHRRRARFRAARVEEFRDVEIFQRDGWMCGICHQMVDKRLRSPNPMRASLDHIIPLAKGGHHERSNVQCSHWLCNSRKGDRGGGQLRLFG